MDLKNKSIVVTGGAGFIGSHLVDGLIKENPEKLIVLSNFFIGSRENLKDAQEKFPNLEIKEIDVTNYDKIESYFKNNPIDVVFNLAVIPIVTSLTKPAWTFKTNVDISATFCELARKDYFKKLVQFSSSEVYGTAKYIPMDENHPLNPETPYAASKAATDHLVLSYFRTFGIDISLVRPFNNYGPRQSATKFVGLIPGTIVRAMKNEDVIIQGDGKQTRDYIFVEDTIKGAIKVAKSNNTKGRVVNIATGKEISINYLLNELNSILNKNIVPVHMDERAGDIQKSVADISKFKTLLNIPITDFNLALKETIKCYQ